MISKTWIPAVLALGVAVASVGGSACFTGQLMNKVQGQTVEQTPALRVLHTYVDGKGRLAVLAEGGVWQEDRTVTPRAPVWFEVDVAKLAPANHGLIMIPQSALQSGTPDLAQLAQEGFVEIPFAEESNGSPVNMSAAVPPVDAHYVKVSYFDGLEATNEFPEKIGYNPQFAVEKSPPTPDNPVRIVDQRHVGHPAAIIFLPLTVAADIVTIPFLVIAVITMK